jgi:hypothetical protein
LGGCEKTNGYAVNLSVLLPYIFGNEDDREAWCMGAKRLDDVEMAARRALYAKTRCTEEK